MSDQRLTGKDGAGHDVALGVIVETDASASLQAADIVARVLLGQIQTSLVGAMAALTASSEALTLAANAEQAEADTIMAHTAELIAAAGQIQAQANLLVAQLNTELGALVTTQALITQMAQTMTTSFGTLEDVRSVVQSMLNSIQTLLASTFPLPVPLDPVGTSFYGTVGAITAELETTVAQLVVPAGETLVCSGFSAFGSTADAIYRLYIGATPVLIDRTNAAVPASHCYFPQRALVRAGSGVTVRLTVTHSILPRSQSFEGLIHGYYTTP